VLKMVEKTLGKRGAQWTASAELPGGDFPVTGFDALRAELGKTFPFLAADHLYRLARGYGTETRKMLAGIDNASGLGRHFGATLYEAEVRYLMAKEWARTAEDVLWRRSKLGLRLSQEQAAALNLWMIQAAEMPALKAAQ
jgi:glycerol-3-phosphate dehydrogenase